MTSEHKKKIGLANKGKTASLETRKKLSETHMGYKMPKEQKVKIGLAQAKEKHWNWKGGLAMNKKEYNKAWARQHRATESFKEYRRKYNEDNRERLALQNKEYRLRNAARLRDAALKAEYGITLVDYNALLIKQEHKCAICKGDEAETIRGLYVDHNHRTGRVRGLLCQKCNSGVGFLQDSITLMQSAISYLLTNDE